MVALVAAVERDTGLGKPPWYYRIRHRFWVHVTNVPKYHNIGINSIDTIDTIYPTGLDALNDLGSKACTCDESIDVDLEVPLLLNMEMRLTYPIYEAFSSSFADES